MIKNLLFLTKYQTINFIRAKWLIVYATFFFMLTSSLLMFGSDSNKATTSILSIILFIVPMISILYSSIYWYNSESFTHLLLTQPLRRSIVFSSNWLSIGIGLAGSFVLSTGLALLVNGALDMNSIIVLFLGCTLTFIFVGIGLFVSSLIIDRMKGVGIAFLIWFYFAILHDVLVFTIISIFKDYPVEIPAMLLMVSNPIDLIRIHVLLILDVSAMMGYTGKILQNMLSGPLGVILINMALFVWLLLPLVLGLRIFSRRDL